MNTKKTQQEELKRFKSYFDKSYGAIFCFDMKQPYSVDLPVDTQIQLMIENAYFSQVNNGLLKAYGYKSPEDMLGKEVYFIFDKDDPATPETFRMIVESKYDYHELLTKELDANGNTAYFLNELVPEIVDGKLTRVWGTSFNVTDRVLSEEFEHLINELITHFLDCPFEQIDDMMRRGLQKILDFINFDWGILYERDEKDGFQPVIETSRKSRTTAGRKVPIKPITSKDFPHVFEHVVHQKKSLSFSSVDELPNMASSLKSFAQKHGILAKVYVPLIVSGRCNALLTFSSLQHSIEIPETIKNRLILLGEVFGRLIQRRNSEIALQAAYSNLEEKVKLRTQKLTDALLALRNTQAELIKSEKLAVLGQLVSGVAHEINNPLGAINASNENILHAYEKVKQLYPALFQKLEPAFQEQFLKLLISISPEDVFQSSLELRNTRRALLNQLEQDQIPNPEQVAEVLTELGLIDDLNNYYDLLKHGDQELIIDTLHNCGQILLNSNNIRKAVDQTSKIVFALNAYNYNSKANKRIKTSIPDTIENALIIFQSKLKQDIELVKKYNEVPNIMCNPTEISQVWVNIIQNALQAMKFQGTLEIEVKEKTTNRLNDQEFDQPQSFVVASFTNDGPKIPEAEMDQIFEPFFTTKPAGEGTGLGLDLSLKIIHDHGGDIAVASQPGKTTFEVWLPVDLE